MVVHAYNSGMEDAEIGGSQDQGQPGRCSEFHASNFMCYSLVSFSKLKQLCSLHHNPVLEHFQQLRPFPYAHVQLAPIPAPGSSQPLILSISRVSSFLEISCRWNLYIAFSLL
jgi:hypothetical protein